MPDIIEPEPLWCEVCGARMDEVRLGEGLTVIECPNNCGSGAA